MTDIVKKNINFFQIIRNIDERHPYLFAFVLSLIFMGYVLFKANGSEVFSSDVVPMSDIEFVDIELVQPPKQEVDQEISTEGGEVASKKVNRASGVSDEKAVDLAFYPNVAPPKVVGRLRKIFPALARDNDVQAVVNTEIMIDSDGKVRSVNVLHVRFSKEVAEEIKADIRRAFIRDTKKILMSARFTPAIINGEKKAVLMQLPVTFELE